MSKAQKILTALMLSCLMLLPLLQSRLCLSLLSFRTPPATFQEEPLEKLPPCMETLLTKPLLFLGMGSQCVVFAPSKEPYVCKICKASRYEMPSFLEKKPLSLLLKDHLAKKRKEKEKRRLSDFSSYQIAYEHLQQECGILFMHLHQTNSFAGSFTLIDPLLTQHKLDADKTLFYIQRKTALLSPYIQDLLKKKQKKEIELLLQQIIDLALQTGKKGIRMKDISHKNIGIYEKKPLWIDPGRLIQDPSFASNIEQKNSLDRLFLSLQPFFLSLDPEIFSHFQSQIENSKNFLDLRSN
jgi:hypothetical protein